MTAPLLTVEQVAALLAVKPALVRVLAHRGELPYRRIGEKLQRIAIVEARYAKNGREREVPLGDVAFGLLEGLKPEKAVPQALVFRAPSGKAIKSVGTWWTAAVLEVWKPLRPSERRPRFHDLRKTVGTRVEAVSSHAVAKRLLGHSDEDVTDSYLMPTLEDVRAAVNRAGALIDGEGEKLHGTNGGTVTSETA